MEHVRGDLGDVELVGVDRVFAVLTAGEIAEAADDQGY